jgi:hypothetical protein
MSSKQLPNDAAALPDHRALALRTGWCAYLVLLVFPLALSAVVVFLRAGATGRRESAHDMNGWFLIAMAYLIVGIPAALFYRRHLCISYFRGSVVAPRQYLIGMLTVWLTLEFGMILSIVGCYVTTSFLPCLLPALLAFMFLITLWPNGRMMVSHVGNSNDPQIYEEPR